MTVWYNEIDPKAAAWLRELIAQGHIAPGVVDERSIEDIAPADLHGFTQCHFFAGIGVWSYALRRAGWSDDRPVWTGSCPCQPFSAAGKGDGFADERHLWPSWQWLIEQCNPPIVFGEQVASKDAEPWLDLVQADLEALAYAVGACAFPSAGVGAPHIRDRLYWVADADRGQLERLTEFRGLERDGQDAGRAEGSSEPGARRVDSGLEHTTGSGRKPCTGHEGVCGENHGAPAAPVEQRASGAYGGLGGNALPHGAGAQGEHGLREVATHAGPVNGLWRDADWLYCRDGIWRPVEPGTFPLAHGAPARVGRLRGYGNAINAEAATAWIEAYQSGDFARPE